MNPWVIRGLFTLGGMVVGYLFSEVVNEDEKGSLKEENERLRRQLRSVLTKFERESSKMESAIADIVSNPPASIGEMRWRLRAHGLTEKQVERVADDVRAADLYGAA
jgi:hypothetical protein